MKKILIEIVDPNNEDRIIIITYIDANAQGPFCTLNKIDGNVAAAVFMRFFWGEKTQKFECFIWKMGRVNVINENIVVCCIQCV